MAMIFGKTITITGIIVASGGRGQYGSNTNSANGGAAAGGSVLLKAEVATLGTTKITALGGVAYTNSAWGAYGGNGAVGRIHLDYSVSYTGTTNPTIDATETLYNKNTGAFFQFL